MGVSMCVNKFNQTTMSPDTCILLGIWARRIARAVKKKSILARVASQVEGENEFYFQIALVTHLRHNE